MPRPRTTTAGAKTLRVLEACPTMRKLVRAHPRRRFRLGDPYDTLLGSICSQQISTKVARVIYARVRSRFKSRRALAGARISELRGCGLSAKKSEYARGIARFTLGGGLRRLDELDDAAVVERLVGLSGVGVWTAQMFLMFALGRRDVWPIGDYGIVQAIGQHYGIEGVPAMRDLGDRFRPHRSFAARYLWAAIDG